MDARDPAPCAQHGRSFCPARPCIPEPTLYVDVDTSAAQATIDRLRDALTAAGNLA